MVIAEKRPSPEVLENPEHAYHWVRARQASGKRIGLVPTMGALHRGHLSLVEQAWRSVDEVVVSIFVNPTQFAPNEDLDRYPRPWEQDLRFLREVGAAAVFRPSVEAMYPAGFSTYVHPPEVSLTLEGNCRPDHFRGVATVVLKLFQIVPAEQAFFGLKDYQQYLVIRRMVADLALAVEVVGCPTVRESDGLALSSRNQYLSPQERQRALSLSRALQRAAQAFREGQTEGAGLEAIMRQELASALVDRIDYAVVCDCQNLQRLDIVDRAAVALIAAWIGKTRLIDNLALPAAP